MEVTTTTKNKETKTKSNKRKRMSTSTSLRSITQEVPKKMKKKNVSINPVPRKSNYRLPKYLKKAPNLLFQALCLQLKKKLNKKTQQRFLHYRLQLIDQQYRLNLYRNLWQSYFTLGSEQQIWPVSSKIYLAKFLFIFSINHRIKYTKWQKQINMNYASNLLTIV